MNTTDDKYKVIFVLGAPGSGKNTQCDLIVGKFNLFHFSCGELLREAVASQNEEGKLINEYMREGKIVPARITCGLAKNTMERNGGKKNVYLIDGFPRNKENLEGWLEVFGDECQILAVLFLECPEEVCTKRIKSRSSTSNRVDDNDDSIRKRFRIFQEETLVNIEVLKGITNIIRVNADRTKELIAEEIANQLSKILSIS